MVRLQRCFAILISTALGLALALTAFVGNASAHAKVIDSNPKASSTIASAPTTVTVTTAENMNPDPKLSNLWVYGPDGELISEGSAKIPLNNPKEMSVGIKGAGNGVYVVRWATMSADDNEADEGAFTFTVQAGASATPTTSTAARPTTTTAPTATQTPSTNTGFPMLPVVVSGLIALVVGLGAGFGLGRAGKNTSTGASTSDVREQTTTKSGS